MNPEVYQRPLTFTTAQTVYWSGRSNPGGPTWGQLCLVVNSSDRPELDMLMLVIFDVTAQPAMSAGELYTAACRRSIASFGEGPDGPGVGTGVTTTGAGVRNVCGLDHGPFVVGS